MLITLSLVACVWITFQNGDDHVLRHRDDIDALESHGAHVQIAEEKQSSVPPDTESDGRIAAIFVPEEWNGGDEDLQPIHSIFSDAPDPKPVVYVLGKPMISAEKLKALEESLPAGSIQVRAPVVLGILTDGQTHPEGLMILEVQADSAAAEAGLKKGDIIKKMDGAAVNDFDFVASQLFLKKPKQMVVFTVLRDRRTREIDVRLKGWYLQKVKLPHGKR